MSMESNVQKIVYKEEELEAMRQVRTLLVEEHGVPESKIGNYFLAIVTINCKLRVEETVTKIMKLLEVMEQLGVSEGIDDKLWKPESNHELKTFAPCGTNFSGASTVWVVGGSHVSKENEAAHVYASIMHYMASHADAISLRQGITFVVDVTKTKDPEGRIGNEGLIQSFYQALPQRPQQIYIAGTNSVTRAIVNTSIKLASVFIKQKILDRIKFVTVDEAKEAIPMSSVPKYIGGMAGGIDNIEDHIKARLELIPMPEL